MGAKNHLRIWLLALAFGAAFHGGHAAAKTLILSEKDVTRFLASVPEVRAIGLREGMTLTAKASAAENPIGALVEAATSARLREEVGGVVARHGFQSVRQWARTGQSIGQAYVYVTVGPVGSAIGTKLEERRDDVAKEVDKLGFLSEKQKRKLMQQFDETSEDIGKEPPPENVAVVKSMKGDIDAVVNSQGK